MFTRLDLHTHLSQTHIGTRLGMLILVLFLSIGSVWASSDQVTLLRTPDEGIQPQTAVDARGKTHLIYFKGEPRSGDVFYVSAESGQETFSKPIMVNSQPKSVIAVGTVRGAHMAIGRNGRVHVAWMGARKDEATNEMPMAYTRLNDDGTTFEPQRNVIQNAYGLDGGGSIAADGNGNVYVVWHAGHGGEENRRVWVTHSSDGGETFAPEVAVNSPETGVCGCCGIRAFADGLGSVYIQYRAATEKINRDMHLLVSQDSGKTFEGTLLQKWEINACPMTTSSFFEGKTGVLLAWQTKDQVYYTRWNPSTSSLSEVLHAPGFYKHRKHPAVAENGRGETIFAWTEGTGWNKGGSLAWQVYDQNGKPTDERGRVDGVPVWGLATAVARPDDGFTIVY